jgi:hypothetical protein
LTTYTVYLRDANRNRIAQIDDFDDLEVVLRYNDVSSWVLEVPAGGDASTFLTAQPVAGIAIYRDDTLLLSGPVKRRERRWDEKSDSIVISGVDDTAWLGSRLALQPALGGGYYEEYATITGPAETVMRQFVDQNGGASSATNRLVPGLTSGTDYAKGATVTGRSRFGNLLEIEQYLGMLSGLGFWVYQSGTSLVFDVYQPVDRRTTVRFSPELGNLGAYEWTEGAPEVNYVYVAGQGEGTARLVIERQDSTSIAAFGRYEQFRDARDVATTSELEQRGDELITDKGSTSTLAITPIDSGLTAYGRDYRLGDIVTVTVDDVDVVDRVREVHIRLRGDSGEQLEWRGQVTELPAAAANRRLRSRLALIERA